MKQVDDKGRCLLVPLAIAVIGRTGALHADNAKLTELARRLNADQIPAARK